MLEVRLNRNIRVRREVGSHTPVPGVPGLTLTMTNGLTPLILTEYVIARRVHPRPVANGRG